MPEELELFNSSPPHPGKALRRLLDQKGWTQDELAAVTGYSRQAINELVSGKIGITPEMAVALAATFDISAAEWMKADATYRLSLTDADVSEIQKRAHLFDIAPIRNMQKRGWIKQTKQLEELETELRAFFCTDSLDTDFVFPVNALRAETLGHLNPAERAWCFRARHLAAASQVQNGFDDDRTALVEKELRALAAFPQEARRVPQLLSRFGIRLVIVEPLATAKIDGAAFWLDDHSPTIAVTVRYDRIDGFWFTLMHEFAHIRNHDQPSIDLDLVGEKGEAATILLEEEHERRASAEAAASLIPTHDLDSFIRRVGPLYSRVRIIQFAHRMKIHPGIVVGQLQHRGEIKFSHHHQLLAKVRNVITENAVTDGWGRTVSPAVA